MANDEHVALLKQGVAAWNAWRDENPEIHPNFHAGQTSGGADLRQASLAKANLNALLMSVQEPPRHAPIEADLSGAHLIQADL
jgi:hypothetical protein